MNKKINTNNIKIIIVKANQISINPINVTKQTNKN